jgi:hypothetical protein
MMWFLVRKRLLASSSRVELPEIEDRPANQVVIAVPVVTRPTTL